MPRRNRGVGRIMYSYKVDSRWELVQDETSLALGTHDFTLGGGANGAPSSSSDATNVKSIPLSMECSNYIVLFSSGWRTFFYDSSFARAK
jgi:hypothetical protein